MSNSRQWFLVLALALAGSARAADGGALARYSGTAVDERGQPVAGATVECYVDPSPVSFYTAQDFALKERGTTDSKGGFTVSIGGGVTIVVVKKEGLAPGWRTFASVLEPSSDPVVLTGLATPARSEVDADGHLISYSAPVPYALEGRVVDENGRPVAGADVWVTMAMPVPGGKAPLPAVVPGVDPLVAMRMPAPAGGEFSQSSMIFGKPARDCFSTRTGADGRFRIANFPGITQANLTAHKSGMALNERAIFGGGMMGLRGNLPVLIGAPPPYFAGLQDALPTAAFQHELMPFISGQLNIELPLERAGNIEGKVIVQGTEQALPGAKLLVLFSGSRGDAGLQMPETVVSGADGSFRIADIRPGGMGVAAVFPGEPVAEWMAEIIPRMVLAGETTKDVSVRAVKGEMAEITVLQRKDRNPITNVTVISADDLGGALSAAVTGPDGVARVSLRPGNWRVSASREGWNDGRTVLNVVSGQTNHAEILFDWHYRVTGIVRDPSGAPVAGAIITLNPGSGNGDAFVKTDANGRYVDSWNVFAGGNMQSFTLLARSGERHLAVNHRIDASTTNLDLNLQPAVTVMAKVEDPTGKPVPNAVGWLVWRNGDRSGALGGSCKSDAQGLIEFADMPPEDGYSISVSAVGYGIGGGNVMSPVRQTNRLQFPAMVLPVANNKLAGRALTADGKPVAGVNVSCSGVNQASQTTRTDAEGHFSFEHLLEATLRVSAYRQPAADGQLVQGDVQARAGETNVVLRLMQYDVSGQIVVTKPALTITGAVLDPDGAPAPGAIVRSVSLGDNPQVKADASGHYEISWPVFNGSNGVNYLMARSDERQLAAIHKIDGTSTNVDLNMEPCVTVRAKVEDSKGSPVTNAPGWLGVLNGFLLSEFTKSDSHGILEFTNTPRIVDYSLNVEAKGYVNAYPRMRSQDLHTNLLEFPTIVLKLANQPLTGTIFDTNGRPAAGVRVKVWGDSIKTIQDTEKTGEVRTGPDGRYLIKWTKQDWGGTQWSPFIFARDLEHNLAASKDIDETTTNLDLTLQPALTLSAKVQDASGKPIATATEGVTLWSGLAEFQFTPVAYRADDQGIIEITALPQGRHYSASISAPGYGSAYPVAQIGDTQTNQFSFPTVVLKAADRKLAGQVLNADGAPVPQARVSIGVNAQSGWRPTGSTTTDAQGRFSFDNIAEGTFQMMINGQSAQAQAGDTNVVFRFGAAGQRGAAPPRTVTTSGTVFDPSGAPDPGMVLWMAPGIIPTNSKSDAAGKFTVSWRALPVMEALLVGRDLEHGFAGTASFGSLVTNVDLHLQRGLTLSGSVQDDHGAVLKDAKVQINITTLGMSAMFIRQPGTVDDQGAFVFNILPQGQAYSLSVSAPDFALTYVKVGADQSQTASLQLPPIKLQRADRPLEGQVVGPDDKPVPGATVRVTGEGQPNTSTLTDANGHFALKVCEGTLHLYVSMPPGAAGARPVTGNMPAQAGDTNVVVKLAALAVPAAVPPANGQSPANRPPISTPSQP